MTSMLGGHGFNPANASGCVMWLLECSPGFGGDFVVDSKSKAEFNNSSILLDVWTDTHRLKFHFSDFHNL